MDAANLYAVMTILASVMHVPLALLKEGALIQPTLQAMIYGGYGKELFLQTALPGIFYYQYNEVAFLCLDNVTPMHHQASGHHHPSVAVFGTTMAVQGALGSFIAMGGVLLYSLA